MNTAVHFSSKSDEWSTPQDLFDDLDAVFHFDLDACASRENAKCRRFFTRKDDALAQEWKGVVWMNPPYGRQIGHFVKKAHDSSLNGATVVCLLPARTDTRWWHDYVIHGHVIFLRGRLKFEGGPYSAPFPSAVVIFWGGVLGKGAH